MSINEVIYSAGKVFDNLRTGRLDTDSFLRHGDTSGIASRADLELLRDLQSAAGVAMSARQAEETPSAHLAVRINGSMTRSAALRPGVLRTAEQNIGVATPYGRHSPPALTLEELQALIEGTQGLPDVPQRAAHLFVAVAAAQPFEDGNKRTALLLANTLLPGRTILAAPYSEDDATVSSRFHDLLSQAYMFGETGPAAEYLVHHGLQERPDTDSGGD
ncbi:Fic family protein [Corynebacterium sp.]|uniref:Fic family protein n=1 Tax=Corynebacterium sp. TaxID=1720 RepID=UPI0026DFCB5F|nr:Fic family protein [Corynebacterium sp.]MDO5511280.1 Fic family protein [Corynebacterium sp.]